MTVPEGSVIRFRGTHLRLGDLGVWRSAHERAPGFFLAAAHRMLAANALVKSPVKKYLFTPGPAPVPPEVLLEMARPMIHHRTPEFSAALDQARERMRPLFGTRQEVILLAASGTGAMEAAVTNLLAPGEHAIYRQWRQVWRAMGQAARRLWDDPVMRSASNGAARRVQSKSRTRSAPIPRRARC